MTLRFLAILLAFGLSVTAASACSQPQGASALKSQMIEWINSERRANGLPALRQEGRLAAAAQGHACDMAVRGYFSHQRSGGPNLSARLKGQGYRLRTAAENIAKVGSAEVSRAANVWRKSDGHYQNILNRSVTDIGMGVAVSGGQVYWVMNVGRAR
jgi:uncharacterized protein YkwD